MRRRYSPLGMHLGMLDVYESGESKWLVSGVMGYYPKSHLPLRGQLEPDGPQSYILNHGPLPS